MNIEEFVNKSETGGVIFKVTPDVYYSFMRCSNDFNPLHTDYQFAKEHGFKDKVMYGNILNVFISYFVGMALPTREVMIQSQDISFHKPVYLDDQIELQYAIDNVSEAVNSISYKLKFYRHADTKPQLVAKGHVSIGLI